MSELERNSKGVEPLREGKATDYLASERTFLAWIRTSIAVIGLGFVVAKFSVWLRELAAGINPQSPIRPGGASLPLGVANDGVRKRHVPSGPDPLSGRQSGYRSRRREDGRPTRNYSGHSRRAVRSLDDRVHAVSGAIAS